MRTSGILMHISSLPSKYGIGTMGKEAKRFVNFLADFAGLPDKLRGFPVPVVFKFCRQSLFY